MELNMKLAWKEIKYSKAKYLLIESILVLLIFMVLFLSGLANGLGRAVSAAIERQSATYYLLSEDSQNIINVSKVPQDYLTKVQEVTSSKLTGLNVQRSTLKPQDSEDKLDVQFFAVDPVSFLVPDMTEGNALSDTTGEIVLNRSFQEDGVSIGDQLVDSFSGMTLTVVGFTDGELYAHSPVGFISTATYISMNQSVNPNYAPYYNALVISGQEVSAIQFDGYQLSDQSEVIKNIPGYSAEQVTINMILWVLVVISAAILGVFFYVITIQKQKQFGVLKAIGMGMGQLNRMIIGQVLILAVFGVVVGNILAFSMASVLPSSMPFYLENNMVVLICLAFIGISLLTSVISTRKVAKVDPIITIGGNEA
jgi:putative ABC transport system permease protein